MKFQVGNLFGIPKLAKLNFNFYSRRKEKLFEETVLFQLFSVVLFKIGSLSNDIQRTTF